jgi:glycosyltransferase involved in cell wall biosynthesis
MNIVHLTASSFFGGPERQMLGLARNMPEGVRTIFASFSEGGNSKTFLNITRQAGFDSIALSRDTPRFFACIAEITEMLKRSDAHVLLTHGYKANILGRPAARNFGIPVISVSRGWTSENLKVRLYESIDRWHLRYMDHVVAVSQAQANKVAKTGLKTEKLSVIHNAIEPERFLDPDPKYRIKLERFFRSPKDRIIGAAGRLSPEKGFDVLLDAAAKVVAQQPETGFVIFGTGDCKAALQQQITYLGLTGSVILAGFRSDLDRFIPQFDLFVQSSHTEGLPNVVLESCAAGVPVVATAVGGTPEVLVDGESGYLVPPGNAEALCEAILTVTNSHEGMSEMGFAGRQRVLEHFSFQSQVDRYLQLFEKVFGLSDSGQPETNQPIDSSALSASTGEDDVVAVEAQGWVQNMRHS